MEPDQAGSSRIKANQTQSNQIKPNQTGWRRMLKAEGLMIKDESRKNQAMPQPDSQTQSGPVKPAGAVWGGGFYNRERRTSSCGCATFGPSRGYVLGGPESSRIKPNQTKPNQIKPPEVGGWKWSVVSGQWSVVGGERGGRKTCTVKPSQSQSNRRVLEIMIKITITIRSSYPKVGPVSGQSNRVKASQTRRGALTLKKAFELATKDHKEKKNRVRCSAIAPFIDLVIGLQAANEAGG